MSFPGGTGIKNPLAKLEMQVPFLGWEDSLEKGMATCSSILPGKSHAGYSPWCCKESDMTEQRQILDHEGL